MSLYITQQLVGGFDNNCSYICMNTATGHAIVVDPAGDINAGLAVLPDHCILTGIVLTHTHADHYDGIPHVLAHSGDTLPIYVHSSSTEHITDLGYADVRPLENNDTISIGEQTMIVLHTPGHSPDSCCYYTTETTDAVPVLLSGDTLFVHGCGRTTPEQAETLYASLERLKALPEETVVYPGHDYGPTSSSTIEEECRLNRFFLAPDFDHFLIERFPSHT